MKKEKAEFEFVFTKDGEPFVMPEFDESAWNEKVKQWNEMFKQMEALARENRERAVKEWQKYGVIIPDSKPVWEEILQRIDAGKEMTSNDFQREFPAIRAFLESKGMILPNGAEEFVIWFIFIKYRKHPFGEMIAKWPNVKLSDFKEFHRYKEHLFKHGGKVGDYPQSWQQIERIEKVELRPAFSDLFFSDNAARRALNAAMTAGIIDETGKRKLGVRKIVPAIVQFWEAVSDPKLEFTRIRAMEDAIGETYLQQCQAIAEQFRTTISDSSIYDHAGKRRGVYFTAVARALGGT